MRNNYINDKVQGDMSQGYYKSSNQAKNNDGLKRAESFENIGSLSNTTMATTTHNKSKSYYLNPSLTPNNQSTFLSSFPQIETECSPNFIQNMPNNFSQLSNQSQMQDQYNSFRKAQNNTTPTGTLKFIIKINDENQQEFDTEHDMNTKTSQLYMDISQLKQTKIQNIVLYNKGVPLPCDNTPIYMVIQEGDQIITRMVSEQNQTPQVFTQTKSQTNIHSSQRITSPISSSANIDSKSKKLVQMSANTSPKRFSSSVNENLQSSRKLNLNNFSTTPKSVSPISSPRGTNMLDSQAVNPYIINSDHQLLENQLDIKVLSTLNYVQLFESQAQQIPVMISLNTKKNFDSKQFQRPPIDLVCVLDNSGSMHGEKINMLKETLLYLIDQLNDRDRLGLVLFSSEVTFRPMKMMDNNNKLKLKQYISEIRAQGGTDINLGMTEAFKFIKTRKYCNPVTSVFLLSDGLDSKAQERVANTLKVMNVNDQFSINCFGFGRDHDPMLMNQISKIRDGSFYYIDKIDQVDMFFVDALGGLFSVIGQDVLIKVKSIKDLSRDVNIVRNYGDMWHMLADQDTNGGWEYCIKLSHLLLGTSKDYMCELQIPAFPQQHMVPNGNDMTFVVVEVSAFTIQSQPQRIKKQAILQLQVYNESANIPKAIKDVYNKEVQLNFLRVKGAKALQDCIEEAQNKRYKQGQQILTERLEDIERAQLGGLSEILMLRNDLLESRQALVPGYFEKEGLHKILANQRTHMEQRSKANNLEMDCYQNSMQKEMIKRRMRQKLGLPEEEETVIEEEVQQTEPSPVIEIPPVVEEVPKLDLYKSFCKAAKDSNVLYIIENEIPNFEQYFRDQIEPKMVYDGYESIILNDKLQDCLSKNKLQSLAQELKKSAGDVELARQNNAEILNQLIHDDLIKAVAAVGVDLNKLVDGDIDKVIKYLAENGIDEIGEMPELNDEFSKRQLRTIKEALLKSQTNPKIEKYAKVKGIISKKRAQQAEKDRQLVEEILGKMKKAMNCTNDKDFEQVEVLVNDIMTFKSISQMQSRDDIDFILDKEIQKIQKNVLYDLQGGLFNIMCLKHFKDYFKQVQQSSDLFN